MNPRILRRYFPGSPGVADGYAIVPNPFRQMAVAAFVVLLVGKVSQVGLPFLFAVKRRIGRNNPFIYEFPELV
ncbi:MAG: hypothetical protein JXA61_03810 [Bacteroidales bacterium]|nr:hypothetical protein [Bacteroidales bacterium]